MGRDNYPWYRKSKRAWYVWDGEKQRRLAADKDAAFEEWHKLRAGTEGQEAQTLTVAALVEEYLAHVERTKRHATLVCVRKTLLPLCRDWRMRDAATVTPVDVVAWITSHGKWGQSRRWLAGLHVRATFNWKKLPMEPLGLPGPRSRGGEIVVSDEAHRALLATSPACYAAALRFLHATGCRPAELCSLTAANVDPSGVAVIQQHKTSSSGRPRLIVLTGETLKEVLELARKYPEGPIFRNTQGDPLTYDTLRFWVRDTCKRLGIGKVRLYGYRHKFATDALVKGIPDAIVAQLLGHSGTEMLHKHYSHLADRLKALREAAEKARPKDGEAPQSS